MSGNKVSVKMKLSQAQAGRLYIDSIKMEKKIKVLKNLVGESIQRLSSPRNSIRGEGFRSLMARLRSEVNHICPYCNQNWEENGGCPCVENEGGSGK